MFVGPFVAGLTEQVGDDPGQRPTVRHHDHGIRRFPMLGKNAIEFGGGQRAETIVPALALGPGVVHALSLKLLGFLRKLLGPLLETISAGPPDIPPPQARHATRVSGAEPRL